MKERITAAWKENKIGIFYFPIPAQKKEGVIHAGRILKNSELINFI